MDRLLRKRYRKRLFGRLWLGFATKPFTNVVLNILNRDQPIGEILPQRCRDPPRVARRQVMDQPAPMLQREVDLGMGERQSASGCPVRCPGLGLRRAGTSVAPAC